MKELDPDSSEDDIADPPIPGKPDSDDDPFNQLQHEKTEIKSPVLSNKNSPKNLIE